MAADERERREFLLRVAHDIRSPITSIGGFVELLEQSFDEQDERLSYVHAIQRAVGRLRDLAERVAAAAGEAAEGCD